MSEPTPDIAEQAVTADQKGVVEAAAKPKPRSAEAVRPTAEPHSPAAPSESAGPARKPSEAGTADPKRLPPYSRSLLRIQVPVLVTLAENRQPLHRIVELGPGTIIQFDKSCEETLQLSVGNHPIANGEAVKVGDKFGLRITSIILPEERFYSLR